MPLRERLDADLKAAMLSGDTLRRDTVRLLISALRNAEIENHGPLDEADEGRVVAREAKQRKDSIAEYRKGNRPDLADREQAELDILQAYMPAGLTDEEVRAVVVAAITRTSAKGLGDMGKVMREVMGDVKGRADGAEVNAIVREVLVRAG